MKRLPKSLGKLLAPRRPSTIITHCQHCSTPNEPLVPNDAEYIGGACKDWFFQFTCSHCERSSVPTHPCVGYCTRCGRSWIVHVPVAKSESLFKFRCGDRTCNGDAFYRPYRVWV